VAKSFNQSVAQTRINVVFGFQTEIVAGCEKQIAGSIARNVTLCDSYSL